MRKYIVIGIAFALTAAFFFVLSMKKKSNIVYVDVKHLFENFDYTKKLRSEYNSVVGSREKILDSLGYDLKVMADKMDHDKAYAKANEAAFNVKRDRYVSIKKQLGSNNKALTSDYDQQIVTQLNQYIKDYGKERGYDFVLGTQGEGNIMHASADRDVTKDALIYINKRFKGEK